MRPKASSRVSPGPSLQFNMLLDMLLWPIAMSASWLLHVHCPRSLYLATGDLQARDAWQLAAFNNIPGNPIFDWLVRFSPMLIWPASDSPQRPGAPWPLGGLG